MVEKIITQYISANKRIVIPGLGTLLRKSSGELVFMELLRKDDGVLTYLVATADKTDENQARASITAYVEKVKKNLAEKGAYQINSIGTLRSNTEGAIEMEGIAVAQSDSTQPDDKGKSAAPVNQKSDSAVNAPKSASSDAQKTGSQANSTDSDKKTASPVGSSTVHAQESREAISTTSGNGFTASSQEATASEATNKSAAASGAPHGAFAVGSRGGSSQGGKSTGTTTAKNPFNSTTPPPSATRRRPQAPAKRKKFDIILLIAIIAAVLAIGAIVYGYWIDDSPIDKLRPTRVYVEEPSATQETTEPTVTLEQ